MQPYDLCRWMNYETLRAEVAAHLDAGGDPREQGNLPIWMACKAGPIELVDRVLAAGLTLEDVRANDNSAFHSACSNGRPAIVQRLLDFGLTLDDVRSRDNHAIYIAASNGYLKIVDILIRAGLTADDVRAQGVRPLKSALWSGDITIAERLLSLGLTEEDVQSIRGVDHRNDPENALSLVCRYDTPALVERIVPYGFTAADAQAQYDKLNKRYEYEHHHGAVIAHLVALGAKPTPNTLKALVHAEAEARATLRGIATAVAAWDGTPEMEDAEQKLYAEYADRWAEVKSEAAPSLRFSD